MDDHLHGDHLDDVLVRWLMTVVGDVDPVSRPAWQRRARCLDADPDVFFPEQGASPDPAVAVCRTCPVVDACLDYALAGDLDVGVFGGMTPEQRRRLTRHVA